VFTIVFFSIRLVPGDPAELQAGIYAQPHEIEEVRRRLGLDKPIIVQYGIWLMQVLHGDLGESIVRGSPVSEDIFKCLRNSAILALTAMFLSTSVGLLSGILASAFSRSWHDRLIMFLVLSGASLPRFWLGLLLIGLFSVNLKALPPHGMSSSIGGGDILDVLQHLILPVLTVSLPTVAIVSRLTRTATLEEMQKQYILAAKARGLKRSSLYLRHALPNVLLPVAAVVGTQAGYLLGGSIIVEVVFSWPGIGQLMLGAISARDYPLVQGCVLVTATAFVVINLFVDWMYGFIDPRVRGME
jgi:peptide/nickel transport system permease protein